MKPNKATKLLSFLTSFAILLTIVFNSPVASSVSVFADDTVTVSVQNKAYVDVLLSRGKTRVNTDKFESDLKEALVKEGVDTSNVKFIKNDSVQMVGSAGFNQYTWSFNSTAGSSGHPNYYYYDTPYPYPQASTILGQSLLGQFGFVSSDLELSGNAHSGGNMILKSTMPSNAYKYTMDFDYNSDFGDNFYGAGVFIQSSVGVNAKSVLIYIAGDGSSSGVYINSTLSGQGIPTYGTKVLSIARDGHLSISVNNGQITINGHTLDGTFKGSDWGFFTSQYSHNCSSIGNFKYSNLKVNIETSKEFKKVLTEEQDSWSDGYTHVLVDCLDDDTEPSFKPESSDFYDVLNLLNISDIRMIGWGTSNNKSTFSNYIKLLPNGGTFCDLGSYNSSRGQMMGYQDCINSTAKYIADLIKQSMREDYVIIDNPTSISVNPDSARKLNKWSFEHDITKLTDSLPLDNNLGYSDYQGKENVKFSRGFQFDKPGIYYIKYSGQLVKKVTAHRNPTAIINYDGRTQIRESLYTYNFSSASFDIDSNSDLYNLGKGIKKLIWRYRTDGGTWRTIEDKTSVSIEINTDKNTDIQLTVVDYLGAEVTTTRTINGASRPVAFFAFTSNPISLHENISIIDSSYDTLGREITKREWTIKNARGKVLWTGTVAPNFTPSSKGWGIGDYTISLTVTNSKGVKSYTYTAGLTVKKVVANALYQFNWNGASHNNYANSVQVEYKNKYPNLVSPKKYYTITYNKNTGTSVGVDSNKVESVFDGWYLDEGLVDKIIPNSTIVKGTGNHMIYAKWVDSGSVTLPNAEKVYKVNFNKNDTALDSANLSTTSLIENWGFTGWYDNSDCTKKIGGAGDKLSNINSNQTLYAGWKDIPVSLPSITRQYKVTFNTNQGTPCNPISSDVEFKGWYDSASGGNFKGKAGDKYSVDKNEVLYAQWGTATFTLPEATKDKTKFIGWFTKPQINGKYNNVSSSEFIGKAGDVIQISESTTLYAWYNYEPVFSEIDDGDFYEGQLINGKDLLKLVEYSDVETTEASSNLTIDLVDVRYADNSVVSFDRDTILDTGTDKIGDFYVTYTITDNGIMVDGVVVEGSQSTVTYTKKCSIAYNSLPNLKLDSYIYTYTGDNSLNVDTIETFFKSFVTVNDIQDEVDNLPWWSKLLTAKMLQSNKEVVSVYDIVINPAFERDHKEIADSIRAINTVKGIYELKEVNNEAFKAIRSYKVELDSHDQWGKYASGRLTETATLRGVVPSPDKDFIQSKSDRSILVICTDDSSYNNTYKGIRFVSNSFINSVNPNSYWGDSSYGKSKLEDILNTGNIISKNDGSSESISPTSNFDGSYIKNEYNKVNITVNDYTK